MGLEEIVALLLADPGFRSLIEEEATKVIALIFHRRSISPDFLAKSDQVFADIVKAQGNPNAQKTAHLAMQALLAEPSSS